MIRHIVMWRVKGADEQVRRANAERVSDAFLAMRGKVPGLQQLEIGIDHSRVDYACDLVLLSTFDNAQALADYAHHPEHLRAKQAAADLRIERYQVDYPMTPEGPSS